MAKQRINRGEVWTVDMGMAAKTRPCLAISVLPEPSDKVLYTLIPHTTTLHGSQYEVHIPKQFLLAGAIDVQGIATMPHPRFHRRLGVLLPSEITLIEDALRQWLGLHPISPQPTPDLP